MAALHFLFYIASLSFTTVAHSLALVYTSPIFVTDSVGDVPARARGAPEVAGILVAVLGVAILAGMEPAMDGRMMVGDASGAGLGGLVRLLLRDRAGPARALFAALPTRLASTRVAACLDAAGRGHHLDGGCSLPAVLSVVAMGVFPLGIGHTLYNAALRRMHPTYVNLVATQEVTGGVLLALLLLGEIAGA